MVELAEILRQAGPAYRKAFEGRMLPSHRRAIDDIVRCRTGALGGSLFRCDDCGNLDYAYHSCRNRHCPKCHHDQTERWIEKLRKRLLPCDYYLLTFTVPDQLWRTIRSNQRLAYSILLQQAAAAVLQLAADRQWVGARPGILAVFHSWSRTLGFHPHVHLLVTAGGLADDGAWVKPAHRRFLFPGYAISKIFRAKVRDAFHRSDLHNEMPAQAWTRKWTVHVKHAGDGRRTVEYLSRYVYRVAITNPRIELFDGRFVTFRYVHSRTHDTRRLKLPVNTFLARFLQHVLPKGFTKVRYYGLFSPGSQKQLDRARNLLERELLRKPSPDPSPHATDSTPDRSMKVAQHRQSCRPCPHCSEGNMVLIQRAFSATTIRAPP